MRKVYKHIKTLSVTILAIVMLFSLGGFSLYTHQCTSQHIKNVSIILPAQDCGHEKANELASCCQVEEQPACCIVEEEPIDDKDCCSDEQHYIKLSIDTVVNNYSPEIEIFSFDVLPTIYSDFNACECLLNRKLITETLKESPPPLTTPEYLSQIQVYII